MSVRRETEQREAIDDGRAGHSRYALSSLTRVSCHSPRREEWAKRALHVPLTHSASSSGRNGTSERKREREVSERPASSITSSGHRLSPPSCDHCWWLKGLEVIRKIWEVNLGFHGRFLPVYHLFPSSTRFLSSYLRSSGCRSSTSLSIHLLRRNEGTEVSEWRTEEGKNGVRNGLSSLIHFAVLSPLLCHSARYTHLVPRSGGVEWEEATRIEVKRAEFQPFVDSVLLTLSPLASFACHSLRSLGGAGPEDGSERGWMACSRAERTENRSERLTHGINVSPLVVMFRPPCVVPSVSTSSGRVFHPLPTSSGRNERREWRTVDGEGDGVGRDSSWLERRDQKWIMGRR